MLAASASKCSMQLWAMMGVQYLSSLRKTAAAAVAWADEGHEGCGYVHLSQQCLASTLWQDKASSVVVI
jgi:hypothetical protein